MRKRMSKPFRRRKQSTLRARPVLILGLSLAGLLIAIAATGLVGMVINRNVAEITENALEYDVNLEDEGDDLRAAVLDLRHYHRDVVFFGPQSPEILLNFSTAYLEVHRQISDYAEIREPVGVLSAEELRALAEEYHQVFEPSIQLYFTDRAAFDRASADGLTILDQLADAAQDIDRMGEDQAERSLANLDRENERARWILLSVLAGLVLVGLGLGWSAFRVSMQFRHLYEDQQASTRRLAEAVQAKADFIADASHELRTPLTVLRGNAEAGLAMEQDPDRREILEDIVSESARMTKLVEDLLLLARSDASSLPLQMEDVSVELIVVELAERARVLVGQRGQHLRVAFGGHGTVNVDIDRLEQAVMALVDNAAKYDEPGSVVRLNTSTWRNECIIDVVDGGAGILPEQVPHIFERFYRIDKARSRRLGGAGLGLPIAKTIVEAHGGRIEAQSQVGVGTTMRIHLPLRTRS